MTAAGFNPHYLLDALNALDAPYVHFSFTAPGKPCLLTPGRDRRRRRRPTTSTSSC
jgi:DNA polymerase-3 subunit beta